jgi:hypothetical protein
MARIAGRFLLSVKHVDRWGTVGIIKGIHSPIMKPTRLPNKEKKLRPGTFWLQKHDRFPLFKQKVV